MTVHFDDTKTTGADELAYAALVFRTLFWLAAAIGGSTWFVLWITPYAFPGA